MRIVLKVGGFAFASEGESEPLIAEYVKLLQQLVKEHKFVVVTGGGAIARAYIRLARSMRVPESLCDQLGILVSRINARIVVDGLSDHAYPEIPTTVTELGRFFASGKLIAMGGLQPGHSTNAVAAIAAETIKAELFVNATNVDGVYTSDPSTDPHALHLDEVHVNKLSEILAHSEMTAGGYDLMDHTALRIIQRSHIPTVIIDGRNLANITKAIHGQRIGTRILTD
ncbi:MAG TPA: UMP kinase [Candidatus Saccharimonadales bacterium]|nr:UMP kinase [Candidatus Saccharimonadales bacterium]